MKIKGKLLSMLFAVSSVAVASFVNAGEITYDTWETNENGTGNYIFKVDDDTANRFTYSLTVDPWNAEALGIFIDFGAESTGVGALDLLGDSSVSLEGRNTTSTDCGPGCNINGLVIPGFDGTWGLVFRLGNQGFDEIQTYNWSTSDFGLSLNDFGVVAVRSQQLCGNGDLLPDDEQNCGGSDKAYGYSTASVPEPGTLTLLALGLLGLFSRRKGALKS